MFLSKGADYVDLNEYLSHHFGFLVLLGGLSIVIKSDVHLDRRMIHNIALTEALLFLYSITYHIESYLGNQPVYSPLRSVLSAVNYSLITVVFVCVIMILFPQRKFWVFLPAAVNAALCFLSLYNNWVFVIDEDNHFQRGPLGYITYVVNALYLAYIFVCLIKRREKESEDFVLILFMSFTAALCLVMPLCMTDQADNWFTNTIAIDVLLYYIFLLLQFTKRDPLTRLLNRKSYYSDMEKLDDTITAIVAMDMNGLKDLNDFEGHAAGDDGLKTLAECFNKAARYGQRVYRIGGDEFAVLCVDNSEDDVKDLVERIRANMSTCKYSCAIGYAMRNGEMSIDHLYHAADTKMYVEKRAYYQQKAQEQKDS